MAKAGNSDKIPLSEKFILTLDEAVEYSSIGINRLRKLCAEPDCPFSIRKGRYHLIKRQEFEKWLNETKEI